VVPLLVVLSAMSSAIGAAMADTSVPAATARSAPPGLTLTVEVVRGKVALPRGFADVELRVVLSNRSNVPIRVNRRLREAVSIASVRFHGVPLAPKTEARLVEDLNGPLEDPVDPLQPGESIEVNLRGLSTDDGAVSLETHTSYTTQQTGRYDVVFNYGFTSHAYEKCFRGPLLSAPVTITVTAAR
jgi:hypothetical protein